MGYVHAEIELTNYDDLVSIAAGLRNRNTPSYDESTGRQRRWDLVINEEIQQQLQLPLVGKELVRLADETLLEVDVVGPVQVRSRTGSHLSAARLLCQQHLKFYWARIPWRDSMCL